MFPLPFSSVKPVYRWYTETLCNTFKRRQVIQVHFVALELIERKGQEYDKDRYCEMLLDAAETLLVILALTGGEAKNRKWWHQLVAQRLKNVNIEKSSFHYI